LAGRLSLCGAPRLGLDSSNHGLVGLPNEVNGPVVLFNNDNSTRDSNRLKEEKDVIATNMSSSWYGLLCLVDKYFSLASRLPLRCTTHHPRLLRRIGYGLPHGRAKLMEMKGLAESIINLQGISNPLGKKIIIATTFHRFCQRLSFRHGPRILLKIKCLIVVPMTILMS
jgi:hypothetical protein